MQVTPNSCILKFKAKMKAQELRRRRRILSRLGFGSLAAPTCNDESEASTRVDSGPMTRSKTQVKRSADKTIPISSSGRKDYGPPTSQDNQGRNLFTRPSDGRLVYLHCCVRGCEKTNFPNAMALRNHVSSPVGLHKIIGLITSNNQAIEVCGQCTPGPEKPSNIPKKQPFGAAPAAEMTCRGIVPTPSTDSIEYHVRSKASSQSICETEARLRPALSKTQLAFKAQNLARAYRTRSFHSGSQTKAMTRAEEAAEVFDGFMSSDSGDSDEGKDGPVQGPEISADRAHQYTSANAAANALMSLQASGRNRQGIGGDDSAPVVRAVREQAIKKEHSTSLSPPLEHSEHQLSRKTLFVALESEQVPNFGTEANHVTPFTWERSTATTGKRASSAPPVTYTPVTKRLRLTDDHLDRLIRSCSRVTTVGEF